MVNFPSQIENFIEYFAKLPGVGVKTATRQALSLSVWDKEEILAFSKALEGLAFLKYCQECGNFSEKDLCSFCLDTNRRESKTLCIIENVVDCLAIEKSENYRGLYHILGGVLNPLCGIGPEELNIDKLIDRIKKEEIKNVILAINPSVEGDATCSYIRDLIPEDVVVDRIGFGVPMGGSLEYLDALTITKALENRQKL